jgi:hypothetical protein
MLLCLSQHTSYACTSLMSQTTLRVTRPRTPVSVRRAGLRVVAGEGRSANRTKWTAKDKSAEQPNLKPPKTPSDEGYAAELVRHQPSKRSRISLLNCAPSDTALVVTSKARCPKWCPDAGMAGFARPAAYVCWHRPVSWPEPTQGPGSHAKAQNWSPSLQRLYWLRAW